MDRFHPGHGPGLAHHVRGEWAGHGPPVWGWLIPLLFLLVIAGLVIWGVLRLTSRQVAAPAAYPGPWGAAPRPGDPALDAVRTRYARGEITREEFLRLVTDLGGAPPAPPPPAAPDPGEVSKDS